MTWPMKRVAASGETAGLVGRAVGRVLRGEAWHPVFVVRDTIDEFAIPIEPFRDLLVAFRQDQTANVVRDVRRTAGLLPQLGEPRRPAGALPRPVPRRRTLASDSICTGLQLANFWQDVAAIATRARLPAARELPSRGLREEMLARREFNAEFRTFLAGQVARAERCLGRGSHW